MEETIVKEWLKSLRMDQYAESFIDNGYDDLEICKQIDAPDLDAIGVVDPNHRSKVLQAVQVLRVEGAASVYFTVEEAQAATQENTSTLRSPNPPLVEIVKKPEPGSSSSTPGERQHFFPGLSGDIDAYEAGRAELIRLPQLQLRKLIQDNLKKDNVNLTIHPYTTKDGERGILEGLASRYADHFNTHFQDVLEHLEYIRNQEWNRLIAACKIRTPVGSHGHLYQQKPEIGERRMELWSPRSSSSSSLDHNEDYPVYIPGKYNPSSCLSDAEEDQIYGFTGGSNPASSVPSSGPGYLNPRSQCIYELPPSRRNNTGVKKKLGLGRLLKTLKRDPKKSTEVRNKTFSAQSNPVISRPICAAPDLSSTPLVVLPGYSSPTSSHCSQSSKSHSSGQSFIVTSASAPGTPGSSGPVRDSGLQQAIERLKEQEIKRRREEQFREHEQILQDIRHGLQQSKNLKSLGSIYSQFPVCPESSYMYDDEVMGEEDLRLRGGLVRSGAVNPSILLHHWYDEPPYESDPEDFRIGLSKDEQRELISSNVRLSRDEDVISLKTAGDISLPRDIMGQSSEWPSPRHFQVGVGSSEASPRNGQSKKHQNSYSNQQQQQQRNYLQMDVIRPEKLPRSDDVGETSANGSRLSSDKSSRRSSRRVESRVLQGQEVPFDMQSVSSKLSNMSVETNNSNRRVNQSSEGEGTNSGSQSELEDEERRDSESLVGRMKMLQKDMQMKISCLKNSRENPSTEVNGIQVPEESLRERLETDYTRYQRQNSLPVKLKQVSTRVQQHSVPSETTLTPVIGRARALVDYQPSPYDKDVLRFAKGDIIDILSKNASGLWRGHLKGKVGHFKYILVEEVDPPQSIHHPRPIRRFGMTPHENQMTWFQKPGALRDILAKFNISQLTQLLLLNGYDSVEHFREITLEDLDHLGVVDPQTRSQVLCAVRFLQESLEELERTQYSWGARNPSFVRHVNGRVSLPTKGSQGVGFYPLQEVGFESGEQIYENTSGYLCPSVDENNLDHLERLELSSSSTDTSSGYHSRPTFNIPVAATSDTSTPNRPESHSPSGSHSDRKLGGHQVSASSPMVDEAPDASIIQKDSYHAQVARVHSSPSPTHHSGTDSTGGETAPSC